MRTGNVVFDATARITCPSARCRFSCDTDTFMPRLAAISLSTVATATSVASNKSTIVAPPTSYEIHRPYSTYTVHEIRIARKGGAMRR